MGKHVQFNCESDSETPKPPDPITRPCGQRPFSSACSAVRDSIYLRYTPPPQKYHSTSQLTRPPYHFHTASRHGLATSNYPLIYRGCLSAERLLTRWTARQQRRLDQPGPGGP